MKAFKGCVNENCESRRKKTYYKDSDRYCPKCGQELHYVCADCWTQLDDNRNRYCLICEGNRKDKKDQRVEKIKDGAGIVVGVAGAVGAAAVAVAKNVKNVDGAVKVVAEVGKKATNFIAKK